MSDLARGQIEMSLQRRPPVLLSTADLPVSSPFLAIFEVWYDVASYCVGILIKPVHIIRSNYRLVM